jgi:hypothetical protein
LVTFEEERHKQRMEASGKEVAAEVAAEWEREYGYFPENKLQV